MKPMKAFVFMLVLIANIFFNTTKSEALKVKDARWGFDDSVIFGRFTPLFVLFHNESKSDNFAGLVKLKQEQWGVRYGATEKVLIQPLSKESKPCLNSSGLRVLPSPTAWKLSSLITSPAGQRSNERHWSIGSDEGEYFTFLREAMRVFPSLRESSLRCRQRRGTLELGPGLLSSIR